MLASETIHGKCLAHFLVHSQNSTNVNCLCPLGWPEWAPSHAALPLHTEASWNCPGHPPGTSDSPAHVAFLWQNLAIMAHGAFARDGQAGASGMSQGLQSVIPAATGTTRTLGSNLLGDRASLPHSPGEWKLAACPEGNLQSHQDQGT